MSIAEGRAICAGELLEVQGREMQAADQDRDREIVAGRGLVATSGLPRRNSMADIGWKAVDMFRRPRSLVRRATARRALQLRGKQAEGANRAHTYE